MTMYNWSVDTTQLKRFPEKYRIWKLEQLINFGLGKEKISTKHLLKYFNKLKIDPLKKKFLKLLLS